jgi:hypothetical protein
VDSSESGTEIDLQNLHLDLAKAVLEAFKSRLSRVPATTGATPAFSNSPTEQVDEQADGEYRIAKYFRNNPKLRDELLDKMRKKED